MFVERNVMMIKGTDHIQQQTGAVRNDKALDNLVTAL